MERNDDDVIATNGDENAVPVDLNQNYEAATVNETENYEIGDINENVSALIELNQRRNAYTLIPITIMSLVGSTLYSMSKSVTAYHSIQKTEFATWFNSAYFGGSLLAVLLSMSIYFKTHIQKRKLMMSIAVAISIIGYTVMYITSGDEESPNSKLSHLILSRICIGFGDGLYTVTIYYYVYECFLIKKSRVGLRNSALFKTKFNFLFTILIVLISGFIPRAPEILLFLIVGLFIVLFYLIPQLPESPFVLSISRPWNRDYVRGAFNALFDSDTKTGSTSDILLTQIQIASITAKTKSKHPTKFPLFVRTGFVFVYNELCGINIYLIYLTNLLENQNMYLYETEIDGKLIFIIEFILVYIIYSKFLSKIIFGKMVEFKLLRRASLYMAICTTFLVIFFVIRHFGKANFIADTLQNVTLIFYFCSYMESWLDKHHVLFENYEPYYMTINLMAPTLVCKFIVLSVLTYNFTPTVLGFACYSVFFSVCSFLAYGLSLKFDKYFLNYNII